jgi:imidazolonepropionase
MTSTLVHNIGQLVTNDPEHDGTKLGLIERASFLIEDGVIAWAGPDDQAPIHHIKKKIDAQGKTIIPGFVDSHTHMIFAGDRSKEFRARMLGESYTSGGIALTVEKTPVMKRYALMQNPYLSKLMPVVRPRLNVSPDMG